MGGFLKWWYPTTIGFPTKNDHFEMGVPPNLLQRIITMRSSLCLGTPYRFPVLLHQLPATGSVWCGIPFKETPISLFLNNLIACREISTAAPPRGRGQGLIRLLPRRVRRARRGGRRWSEGILGEEVSRFGASTDGPFGGFFFLVGSWAGKTDVLFFCFFNKFGT